MVLAEAVVVNVLPTGRKEETVHLSYCRHTIFLWLKTRTLQNKEPYQINVVHILLRVCTYFGFL